MSDAKDSEATTAAAEADFRGHARDSKSATGPAAAQAVLSRARFAIGFSIDLSRRYHQARRDFFDGWNKALMVVVIGCGSAAVLRLIPYPEFLGGIAALVSALNLAFGLSHRARDHELLYRRFTDLAAKLDEFDSPEAAQRERLAIERDEPPVYWLLADHCHWETAIAHGCEPGIERPSFWARLTMNYLPSVRATALPTPAEATPKTSSPT